MTEKENKAAAEKIRKEFGARLKAIRTTAFNLSQRKFGNEVNESFNLGVNPQTRIAVLEQGKGSATIIFGMLSYLYDQGIDINYLFGPSPMYRASDRTVLYAENITDYLDEATRNMGETRQKIDEMLQATYQVKEYVKGTVELKSID